MKIFSLKLGSGGGGANIRFTVTLALQNYSLTNWALIVHSKRSNKMCSTIMTGVEIPTTVILLLVLIAAVDWEALEHCKATAVKMIRRLYTRRRATPSNPKWVKGVLVSTLKLGSGGGGANNRLTVTGALQHYSLTNWS